MKNVESAIAVVFLVTTLIGCHGSSAGLDAEYPSVDDGEPQDISDDGGDEFYSDASDSNCGERHAAHQIFDELWRIEISNGLVLLTPAISSTGAIFFTGGGCDIGTCPFMLFMADNNGNVVWSVDIVWPALPVVDNLDRVTTCSDKLRSYNMQKESICELDIMCDSSIALGRISVDRDNKIILVSSNKLLGISIDECRIAWEYTLPDITYGAPTIGINGQIYIFGTQGLYSFDAAGNFLWKKESVIASGDPASIDKDGSLLVVTDDKKLAKYSHSGDLIWDVDIGSCNTSTPTIDSSGNIYIGDLDGMVAYDSEGSLKWTHGNGLLDSPDCLIGKKPAPLVDECGNVTYFSMLMNIYMIDSEGNLSSERAIEGGLSSGCGFLASPAAISDGVLIGNCEGRLLNLFRGEAVLDESWSKYRFDSRNTGNAGLQ